MSPARAAKDDYRVQHLVDFWYVSTLLAVLGIGLCGLLGGPKLVFGSWLIYLFVLPFNPEISIQFCYGLWMAFTTVAVVVHTFLFASFYGDEDNKLGFFGYYVRLVLLAASIFLSGWASYLAFTLPVIETLTWMAPWGNILLGVLAVVGLAIGLSTHKDRY